MHVHCRAKTDVHTCAHVTCNRRAIGVQMWRARPRRARAPQVPHLEPARVPYARNFGCTPSWHVHTCARHAHVPYSDMRCSHSMMSHLSEPPLAEAHRQNGRPYQAATSSGFARRGLQATCTCKLGVHITAVSASRHARSWRMAPLQVAVCNLAVHVVEVKATSVDPGAKR